MPAERRIRVHALIDLLDVGGAELMLAEFASVAAHDAIELSVGYLRDVGGGHAAARLRAAGIEPRCAAIGPHLGPAAFRAVRRQLATLRPELVHTHLGYADLIGGPAARSLRIPVVCTLHSHAWPGDLRARAKLRAMALARRVSAARVIAVSEGARTAYLASGADRPERVVVVRNGIAGAARPGAGAGVRAELGIAPDELVVAMVSSLRAEKAHDVAFDAVGRLVERFPALRLLVVGDGPLRREVARATRPLADRALLTGHRDDVMAVLDASDVLLHPSRHDALPTTIIEAMAGSVPVVATAVGGIPELVTDGVSGLLVGAPPVAADLADALDLLLRDPARRRALAAAGRERFELEFTAAAWVRRVREVYDAVLATTTCPRPAADR
jgi:glycosyltransferase involved in cell wall biosynthesis